MRFMLSDQRQVDLRRLGNQLAVLGKGNWPCDVGNISLQVTTRYINDSETMYFVIQDYHFDRVMYLFVKLCVFCLLFYQLRLLAVRKILAPAFSSLLSHFFARWY